MLVQLFHRDILWLSWCLCGASSCHCRSEHRDDVRHRLVDLQLEESAAIKDKGPKWTNANVRLDRSAARSDVDLRCRRRGEWQHRRTGAVHSVQLTARTGTARDECNIESSHGGVEKEERCRQYANNLHAVRLLASCSEKKLVED